MAHDIIRTLLRRNTSAARIAGFILSNFIGMAIICCALQFFLDARSIWMAEDSFIHSDFLVVNKKVTSANTLGNASTSFTYDELADIQQQAWVRKAGGFQTTDYEVSAHIDQNGRSMSTLMFFESIPDEFIDVAQADWHYSPGQDFVPLIIAKDYLTLYNFGFASSAGLPQLSEQLMSGLPLTLTLTSSDGLRTMRLRGRVVGYSNRLQTVLVPESFMKYTNARLGSTHSAAASGSDKPVSRVIIDTSSPGNTAIGEYLERHNLEVAGDKTASQASFLLNVVTGVVLCVGAVITLLSFFILLLSISLIMEKNRGKLHELMMLGYPLRSVSAPYEKMALASTGVAGLLCITSICLLRMLWIEPLRGLGAASAGVIWPVTACVCISALIAFINVFSIRRKVDSAWR